ncbi:arylsulfatase [Dyadobacter jejuensis]|nr:arylsulfatase [Dyadobacter jejuensis]
MALSIDSLRGVEKRKPNVIIIMSDDQGWGDLSMNGNPNLQTPHIDRIAKNGARFSHFYVSPVCSPTRAELLTGRYHPRAGVYSTSEGGERINLDETTMADVFKEAGYATAAFGKWHNGMQYPYHPNARGFDEFYGFCSGHWGNYFNSLLEHNGQIVQGNGFIIDDLTDKALEFIDNNQNDPFFLYLPYNTPHSPMQVPDKEWASFKDKSLIKLADARTGEEDVVFTRAALALCENIDWNVGRIQNQLKKLKLDRETIVIYLSDNGPNSSRWNGGMKGKKGSTDEGGVKSPFVIQWPGTISSGLEIDQVSGAVDLLPTLADLSGINYSIPKALDGISLKPLLVESNQKWPDRMLFSHWNGKVSVRKGRYVLDDNSKLFDLTTDPEQRVDITSQKPELTKALSMAVVDWKAEVLKDIAIDNRPFPVGHPDYKYTQLPARDAVAHGTIKRSNKYPNSSYFTNWTKNGDYISWNVDVLSEGDYAVAVYYVCPADEIGSTMQLSFEADKLDFKIAKANASGMINQQYDRVERMESYEKDFKPLKAGVIHLKKGAGELILRTTALSKTNALDFRMMMLTRESP